MSASVESDENGRLTDAERTVNEAAELFECHVETLRRRIRSGSLRASRGPRGAYLIRDSDLVGIWVRPLAGLRRRQVDEDESWSYVARLIHGYERTRTQTLALLDEVRWQPAKRPLLARLVEVQRLRLRGRSYREIATRLNLSERQIRRLARRDLEVALRMELVRDAERRSHTSRQRARDVVGGLEERIRTQGYSGRTRAEIAAAWPKRLRGVQRKLTIEEVRQLRSLGLTAEELEAIALVGIPYEALAHLLSYGTGESDPAGHGSHPVDGAR